MAKISPFKFLQEVRAEGQKVTWPTRKETTVTTMMVFVMVVALGVGFEAVLYIVNGTEAVPVSGVPTVESVAERPISGVPVPRMVGLPYWKAVVPVPEVL